MTTRTGARPIGKIAIAAVVGLNVLIFGALALAGVPLLPSSGSDSGTESSDITLIPLADPQDIPARKVVRDVLAGPFDGLKSAGKLWVSSGTPFDKACPDPDDATPVVSYARPYRAGSQVFSVQVSAYGAGQGAAAVASLADRLETCDGAGTYGGTVGPTSAAVAAWSQSSSSNASSLVWNRADVVVSVTVPRTGPTGLASVAETVDEALIQAMAGTCVSDAESVADAGRSPWSVVPFTGNLVPRAVPLEYPTPSTSPTPVVPTGVPLVPVPAPTLFAPQLEPLPSTAPTENLPTPPVDSSGLPATAAPSPPVAPSERPTSVDVDEQIDDAAGPGCGWAFTQQGSPPFDAESARLQFESAVLTAQQQLRDADVIWQEERVAYAVAYKAYVDEVNAFIDYARTYNATVAGLSDDSYERALDQYEAALEFRRVYDADYALAQQAYEDALLACSLAGSPTATPEPTDPAFPTEPAEPTPGVTEPVEVCPPPIPSIFNEPRPTVPPSPRP